MIKDSRDKIKQCYDRFPGIPNDVWNSSQYVRDEHIFTSNCPAAGLVSNLLTKIGRFPILQHNDASFAGNEDRSMNMNDSGPSLAAQPIDECMPVSSSKPKFTVKKFVDDAKTCTREDDPEALRIAHLSCRMIVLQEMTCRQY